MRAQATCDSMRYKRYSVTILSIEMKIEEVRGVARTVTMGRKSAAVEPQLVGSAASPTEDWVRVQFILAAAALRRLPLTAFERPTGLRSGMPAVVRSYQETFAAQVHADEDLALDQKLDAESRNRGRAGATMEQIDALNRVADWLLWLNRKQQLIVMGRAFGRMVTTISRKIGCSRPTVYSEERKAFAIILAKLASKKSV